MEKVGRFRKILSWNHFLSLGLLLISVSFCNKLNIFKLYFLSEG
ncbi:hypothetical protein HNQ85_002722 [Anoxybacillus calidus]|jgi:hypothetical protein|uniref:Uncharacterized protein n=1 Tax=[Anoxybacillus] calidus TaxID=575178 RepID=A0A7V9Z1X6_9BACL|nr:hypothetical protein [Anoxybacillus calidus]